MGEQVGVIFDVRCEGECEMCPLGSVRVHARNHAAVRYARSRLVCVVWEKHFWNMERV